MDFITSIFSLFSQSLKQSVKFIFGTIDFSPFQTHEIILDIVFVTFLLFFLFKLIEKVHASRIILLSFFLAALLLFTQSLNLHASELIVKGILFLVLISIPLMFQEEFRKNFEKFTQSPFLFLKKYRVTQKHRLIKAIKQSSVLLAEKKHGAIMVIERSNALHTYTETGIPLHATVSKEIIMNIFFPKSPLHDGAIIIRDNVILAAACVLPLSRNSSDHRYGTRHKSSLGISEVTDAIAVIISEERGEISIAHEGKLKENVSPEYLEHYLDEHIS